MHRYSTNNPPDNSRRNFGFKFIQLFNVGFELSVRAYVPWMKGYLTCLNVFQIQENLLVVDWTRPFW